VHLYRRHAEHLDHPGIMSWRIYLEYMWWFGAWVPMFLGSWHLDPEYCDSVVRNCERNFLRYVYSEFTRAIEEGRNPGFIDPYRSGELIGRYGPTLEVQGFLENAEYDPQRLDVYESVSRTYLMCAVFWAKWNWRTFGLAGVLKPRNVYECLRLVKQSGWLWMGSVRHRIRNWGRPVSASYAKLQSEVAAHVHKSQLQPWLPDPTGVERSGDEEKPPLAG